MPKVSIDQTMQDIVFINNQLAGLKMLLDQKKAIMAKYFQKSGQKQVANDEATVYIQERTTIDYDVDAILAELPKELTSQFIDKTYAISDWDGLVRLFKKLGISPAQIRPFISVSKQVNQAKLSALYEKGVVSLADLDGMYEATSKQSIALRMKNTDQQIPIVHE